MTTADLKKGNGAFLRSSLTEIEVRKEEAVEVLTEVGNVLKKRGIVSDFDILFYVGMPTRSTMHNDVYAYLTLKDAPKVIRIHAFVQLSYEMYPKSDRRIITACSLIDYNEFKRAQADRQILKPERIIYNQDHSSMSAELIVGRIIESLPG